MTRKPPTAAQVGRLAGVSQSAVSRAFTPGTSISKRMRERVLRAAEELGYRPNLIARSLATKRSNIVGLVAASLENPFYALLVRELAQTLRPSGRHLLLFPPDPDTELDPSIEEVLHYQVDALVLASTTLTSDLVARCKASGVPILLLNRSTQLGPVWTVTGENTRGAQVIGSFLLAGGHKRIAYLAGLETASTSRDREASFVKTLAAGGQALFARATGGYTYEGAATAARDLLSHKKRPDAIFDGDGSEVTPLSSSNMFFDTVGDGKQHRTAWAGAGDGVLVGDAGEGKLLRPRPGSERRRRDLPLQRRWIRMKAGRNIFGATGK